MALTTRQWLGVGAALVAAAIPFTTGAGAAAAAPPGGERYASALDPAAVQRLAGQAGDRSIVILRNQHPELPATGPDAGRRASVLDGEQASVMRALQGMHADTVRGNHLVNAISAHIRPAEASRVAQSPNVAAVVPDLPLPLPRGDAPAPAAGAQAAPNAAPTSQICPSDPATPLLEPEALQLMHVENQPGDHTPAAHDLVDGAGVKVAFMADGLDVHHPDLTRAGKPVITDYQDFSGQGLNTPSGAAEAFGDAASIAAQGTQTYDLSQVVNPAHPLPAGCTIRVKGVAPGVEMSAFKVFGNADAVPLTSYFLQAMQRAVTVDHVDVINQSFGANTYPDRANDPISLADQAAVRAGVTVVVSTGDAGPTNTIGSPSDAPGVIGVGGTTQLRLYRQVSNYGSPLSPGGWLSDNISSLSSSGFTQLGPRTLDVVAPGDLGWALCSTDAGMYTDCASGSFRPGQPAPVQAFGGTSESAPLVAGVAALVIQAYGKTHHGAKPDPDLVKRIIAGTATDLGTLATEQGAGLVNARKAVDTAMAMGGAATTDAGGLVVGSTSLSATGAAGSTQRISVSVTNTSSTRRTVRPALRQLGSRPASTDSGSIELPVDTAPTFVDGFGTPSAYVTHAFDVPAGTQRLDGDIGWNDVAKPNTITRLSLFDPAGRFAIYSLPQGPTSGAGHVDVRNPAPGRWTAVIWTRKNATGYSGPVSFSFRSSRFETVGSVSPASQVVAPGATATFQVSMPAPRTPGDASASLTLGDGTAAPGSLPVTVRSLVPLNGAGGEVSARFTGGNGRPIFGAQTLTYQLDVAAGKAALNLGVKLRDAGYNVTGMLVDPSGEPRTTASTGRPGAGGATTFTDALQLFQRAPMPGRWTALLILNGPIAGNLDEPFTARFGLDATPVPAQGVPTSVRTVLPAGAPVRATLHVRNTGVSTKDFFVDPRLAGAAVVSLNSVNPTTVRMPVTAEELPSLPAFIVPPGTTLLAVGATSTVPVQMDVSPNLGSPDVEAVPLGTSAVAVHAAPQVVPGLWFAFPTQVGPFGASGPAPASARIGAVATTPQFDRAAVASTGDVWLGAVDLSAPYSPLTLAPGQEGTITVTLTPTGAPGTVVEGSLNLDTFDPLTLTGDQVASVPYAYTVGPSAPASGARTASGSR
jgi:hypothetical protein